MPKKTLTQTVKKSAICAALNVSSATLYRMINDGEFPKPIKVGRQSRWFADDFENYLSSRERGLA